MVCPKCGGTMKVIAFITEYAVVDRIIDHLKLTFAAAKPPPSHVFEHGVGFGGLARREEDASKIWNHNGRADCSS